MSQMTRQEVLARKRDRYARAGKEHKSKIITELVELFGYHRKAATTSPSEPLVIASFRGDFRPEQPSPGWHCD